MMSTSTANPAAWANAFAVSMIIDVGLMRSLMPTDGTNYAGPGERVWGRLKGLAPSTHDKQAVSTLWTGSPDKDFPPKARYLPRLFRAAPRLPVTPADDEATKKMEDAFKAEAQQELSTPPSFYDHWSHMRDVAKDPSRFESKPADDLHCFFQVFSDLKASDSDDDLLIAAQQFQEAAEVLQDQKIFLLNAMTWETSADFLIFTGADQFNVSLAQFQAAQAYLNYVSSVWNTDDDPTGLNIALDRGYLLAMNGVMISLYSSGSLLGSFVDLASKFAEFSRVQNIKKGAYGEAAAHATRLLWLQAHDSDATASGLFWLYAANQADEIAHLLARAFEPMAKQVVVHKFANSARNEWLGIKGKSEKGDTQ